jgi:hypothetical protein
VLGVFAAARDVTAQKHAAEFTRSLIEAALDPHGDDPHGGKNHRRERGEDQGDGAHPVIALPRDDRERALDLPPVVFSQYAVLGPATT